MKLAHQWQLREVKELAIRELQALSIAPLQKVVLYQKYEVDRDLLRPAFIALTTRDEPIEIDEGRELGLETALRLARAREKARVPVFAGRKSGNPRFPMVLAGVELDALIKDVFDLTTSESVESSAMSQTTGQNPPGGSTQSNTQSEWSESFVDDSSQGEFDDRFFASRFMTCRPADVALKGHGNASANGHTNGTPNSHTTGAPRGHVNGTGTPTGAFSGMPKSLIDLRNPFRG